MLTAWLQALHDWEVAAIIRRSVYVYPFVNAAHIFGLILLIGAILPVDLRMLGLFRSIAIPPFMQLMTGISAIGLCLAIASGFLLFSVQPLEYAGNSAFLAKVSLVALGTMLALSVRFSGAWRMLLAAGDVAPGLKVAALASLVIWIGALIAGRWIAFI